MNRINNCAFSHWETFLSSNNGHNKHFSPYITSYSVSFQSDQIIKFKNHFVYMKTMVLIDDNSEISAQVRRNLCNLICLRHLIRSKEVTKGIFSKKTNFPSWVLSYLTSNISTIQIYTSFVYLPFMISRKKNIKIFCCCKNNMTC